jgi:hypothetical protein
MIMNKPNSCPLKMSHTIILAQFSPSEKHRQYSDYESVGKSMDGEFFLLLQRLSAAHLRRTRPLATNCVWLSTEFVTSYLNKDMLDARL